MPHNDLSDISKMLEELGLNDPKDLIPELEEEPKSDLANIENALLTIAESIKYAADTYAEINHKEKLSEEVHFECDAWRDLTAGDYILLSGRGNEVASKCAGQVVQFTGYHPTGRVLWKTLDGKIYDSDGISPSSDRYTIMKRIEG